MSLDVIVLFLLGAGVGVMGGYIAIMIGRKRTHAYHRDPLYAAARFATSRHLRARGTLTIADLRHTLQLPSMTTERYLDQMEREGILKRHGHGTGSFYTRN